MFRRIIKKIFRPIYRLIVHPSIRYSRFSLLLQENIFKWSEKEDIFRHVMDYVSSSKLYGDYLEFGVFKGGTFTPAFYFAKMFGLNRMKFYGFDSFKGISKIKGIDAKGFKHFNEGDCACSKDEFVKIIKRRGVDLKRVELIEGFYDDTLNKELKNKLPINEASVVYVDCDTYESTVPVLNFITDFIKDGSIILFDDWYCYRGDPNRGEQKAFMEWLKRNSNIRATEFRKFGWHGNSFIIHKN